MKDVNGKQINEKVRVVPTEYNYEHVQIVEDAYKQRFVIRKKKSKRESTWNKSGRL